MCHCAPQCVGFNKRTGVVLHAIDAVGVSRQCIHAGLALQRQRQAHAEFACPATPPFGCAFGLLFNRDGGFATAQNHARFAERLTPERHGAGKSGMDLADFPRFAFHFVAQDIRRQACSTRSFGGSFQTLLGRSHHVDLMATESDIARLWRFKHAAFEVGHHAGGHLYAVALQNRDCIGAGCGIRHRRTAGDDRWLVAWHITDGQGHHSRRRAGRCQPPALDARQVFTHAIHLGNIGTAMQQGLVDPLFVFQRQSIGWQTQKRRATARNQAKHQIVFCQPLHHRQNALGRCHACGVRHRVSSFDDVDTLFQTLWSRWNVVITCDNKPFKWCIGWPQRFQSVGHGTTGFTGSDDDSSAATFGCRWLR